MSRATVWLNVAFNFTYISSLCVTSMSLWLKANCKPLWQHFVRHGGVCLYSSLIYACLWMTAWNGLSSSSPLAFHRGSWAWLWRGALVLSACSAGPQDPNTWWACRVPGRAYKSSTLSASHPLLSLLPKGWLWAIERTRWHAGHMLCCLFLSMKCYNNKNVSKGIYLLYHDGTTTIPSTSENLLLLWKVLVCYHFYLWLRKMKSVSSESFHVIVVVWAWVLSCSTKCSFPL